MEFRNKKLIISLLLIVFLFLFALYLPSLTAPFIYDDVMMVKNNRYVTDSKNILGSFHRYYHDSNKLLLGYRPLTIISLNLNSIISGHPASYRIFNLLLHLINSVLVALFIFFILNVFNRNNGYKLKLFYSISAAFIFMVHPLCTMSLNLIWKRSTLLSFLFFMLSLILYLKKNGKNFNEKGGFKNSYLLIVMLFILGLLSKEETATLPIIIGLLGIAIYGVKDFLTIECKKNAGFYLSLLGILGLYYFFRLKLLSIITQGYNIKTPAVGTYLFTQAAVIIRYINLFFVPLDLNIDHYLTDITFISKILSTIVICCFILIGLYKLLFTRELRLIGFFVLFFFVTLIPSSSFFPLVVYMDESRAYLPMIGLLGCTVFFGYALSASKEKIGKTIPTFHLFLILLILLGLSSRTLIRNFDWRSSVSIWSDSVEKGPLNPRALDSLGSALKEKGLYKEAETMFLRAIKVDPDYFPPYTNAGLLYIEINDFKNAEKYLTKAYEKIPNYPLTLNNMAFLYTQKGFFQPKRAAKYYEKLLYYYSDNFEIYYRLGMIYSILGNYEGSVNKLEKALKLLESRGIKSKEGNDVRFAILYEIGNSYRNSKKIDKALDAYNKCLLINPKHKGTRINIGALTMIKGDLNKASKLFKDMVEKEYVREAYFNLGLIAQRQGKSGDAKNYYSKILENNPKDAEITAKLKELR